MRIPGIYHLIFLLVVLSGDLIAHPSYGQQIRRDTLILYFPFDVYQVDEKNAIGLKKYLQDPSFLHHDPDAITITGHTDSLGSDLYNTKLSTRRAASVKDYIEKRFPSLYPARFQLTGRGREMPAGGPDSLNRRAEIVFSYKIRDPEAKASHPQKDSSRNDLKEGLRSSQETDTTFFLDNIFFIEDSPGLTSASRMAMPSYISFLARYKDRALEILGYCNSLSPALKETDPLFKLSTERAKVIYDYLIDAGFDPRKLTYRGMGNAMPVNSKPVTDAEMRENMRVEIKIFK